MRKRREVLKLADFDLADQHGGALERGISNFRDDAARQQLLDFIEGVAGGAVGAVHAPDDQRVAGGEPGDDALIDGPRFRAGRELFDVKPIAQRLEAVDAAKPKALAAYKRDGADFDLETPETSPDPSPEEAPTHGLPSLPPAGPGPR